MITTLTRLMLVCAMTAPAVVVACAEQPDATTTATSTPDGDATTAPQQRLVQIATLETPGANDEFTRNVQIMQARVREVAKLHDLLEQEEDVSAQIDIEVQIEELLRRINDDDKVMADTYRYSLTRRYIRNIEKATVFLILTDEEITNIREEALANGNEPPKSLKSKMLSICTLNTAEAAQGFQRDVATIQAQRDVAIRLQTDVEATSTAEDRAYAQGKLDQVLEQVNALNDAMVKAYGFSVNRNYILRIDKSSLYVWATEDEIVETAAVE